MARTPRAKHLVQAFAACANMAAMTPKTATLGSEIRRLRADAGETLRGFARSIGVSAPHLSDIEHDRRRPSKEVLEKIVQKLAHVGATYEALDKLDARLDAESQLLASENPEVKMMLRTVKELQDSGRPLSEVLKNLEAMLKKGKGRA